MFLAKVLPLLFSKHPTTPNIIPPKLITGIKRTKGLVKQPIKGMSEKITRRSIKKGLAIEIIKETNPTLDFSFIK